MIMDWLGKKALFGVARGWLGLGLIVALAAAVIWLRADENADDSHNQDLGAAAQRADDLTVTLERTEQGNAARDEVRFNWGGARYEQCLRTARTPANCERFLQRIEAD